MKKLYFLFVVIVVVYSKVYSQDDGINELKNTLSNWVDGFNAGDYQKAISIYADDFIGYYHGQPDQTLNNIKEQYQHIFNNKDLTVKISFKADEIKVMDNFAYVRMILTASIKPSYAPQPAVASDKGLQVWHKQNNGTWKLIRSSSFPMTGSNDKRSGN